MKSDKVNKKSAKIVNPAERTKDIYERAIQEAIDRQLASIRHASDQEQ